MRLRVLQQVREVLRRPALRAVQALQDRDAADMVVVKVADQHDVDPVDPELRLQSLQAVQQRAAALPGVA